MSLPKYINVDKTFDPQNTWRSEREIVNKAFGGEENVPTVKNVRVTSSLMRRRYSRRSFTGLQLSYSPYGDRDFIRRVMVDTDGMLDAEKIREKYKEVLKYGKRDDEVNQERKRLEQEQRDIKQELRDEVKEVFSGSEVFKPYNDDTFHYDFSYEETFNRDVVDGHMKVTSSGVEIKLEELTVEESQQVVDFILKMRGK